MSLLFLFSPINLKLILTKITKNRTLLGGQFDWDCPHPNHKGGDPRQIRSSISMGALVILGSIFSGKNLAWRQVATALAGLQGGHIDQPLNHGFIEGDSRESYARGNSVIASLSSHRPCCLRPRCWLIAGYFCIRKCDRGCSPLQNRYVSWVQNVLRQFGFYPGQDLYFSVIEPSTRGLDRDYLWWSLYSIFIFYIAAFYPFHFIEGFMWLINSSLTYKLFFTGYKLGKLRN